MLVRLDELADVERSFSNHTGTLLRITPSPNVELTAVTNAVASVLEAEYRSPVSLSGEELAIVLRDEEWRDASRIGELTSIEIRMLALRGLAYVAPVLIGLSMAVVWWRRKRRSRIEATENSNDTNE